MIKQPENVRVKNGLIEWTPCPCADGYNVHLDGVYWDTTFDAFYAVDIPDSWSVSAFVKFEGQEIHTPRTDAVFELVEAGDKLLWRDDFDTLNPEYWVSEFDWTRTLVINNESQYYVAQLEGEDIGYNPITITDEGLKITAVRESFNGQEWLSGKLCGINGRELTGEFYVEARIKCDFAKGGWPAFWLYTAKYGSPYSEIDIMEQPGIDQFVAFQNYHFVSDSGIVSNENTAEVDTTQWHTYAVKREVGKITWYIDGLPVHTVTENVLIEDLNLIINLALGGNWAGEVDPDIDELSMYVDYVAVYEV